MKENKFNPIYKYIAILSDIITISVFLGLKSLNMINITTNQALFLMLILIIITVNIYIISYLVHIKKIFNSHSIEENKRYNELVIYVNLMQKYFKVLHNYYHTKTDNKTIELRPTNIEINQNFTKEELKLIGYSEYDIETLRK